MIWALIMEDTMAIRTQYDGNNLLKKQIHFHCSAPMGNLAIALSLKIALKRVNLKSVNILAILALKSLKYETTKTGANLYFKEKNYLNILVIYAHILDLKSLCES